VKRHIREIVFLPILALFFCGGCGEAPAKTVPELITMVQSSDPAVQLDGLRILATMGPTLGPQAKEVVPVLIPALKNPHPGVRLAAANALGEMGPEAKDAVPALAEALSAEFVTPSPTERQDPNFDYEAFNNSQVLPLQRAAAVALGKMGPEAKTALPALEKYQQSSGETCSSVKGAIAKISQ
jgi:HEAT repeat protein